MPEKKLQNLSGCVETQLGRLEKINIWRDSIAACQAAHDVGREKASSTVWIINHYVAWAGIVGA